MHGEEALTSGRLSGLFCSRLVVCIVQSLSWRLALQLAAGLAWVAYRLDHRHRQIALDNLRHAFTSVRCTS